MNYDQSASHKLFITGHGVHPSACLQQVPNIELDGKIVHLKMILYYLHIMYF